MEEQQLVGRKQVRLPGSSGSPSSGGLEQVDVSGRFLFAVWALVADRALTGGNSSGFASCHAGKSGRFGARVRSGLLQQDSVRLGGSTVPAPSRVCWKVEQQRSVGRKHGQLPGLSGSLCFGGFEFWNRWEEVMVLDCRCLASRSDLSSLHALQAGLVWGEVWSGFVPLPCRKLCSVGQVAASQHGPVSINVVTTSC